LTGACVGCFKEALLASLRDTGPRRARSRRGGLGHFVRQPGWSQPT